MRSLHNKLFAMVWKKISMYVTVSIFFYYSPRVVISLLEKHILWDSLETSALNRKTGKKYISGCLLIINYQDWHPGFCVIYQRGTRSGFRVTVQSESIRIE